MSEPAGIDEVPAVESDCVRARSWSMAARFILTEYVSQGMAHAVYDKLDDGSFVGRIPPCTGVIAFGATLRECEDEVRSVLEDWVLVGLKLRHPLPVIAGIDLNREPMREPLDAV